MLGRPHPSLTCHVFRSPSPAVSSDVPLDVSLDVSRSASLDVFPSARRTVPGAHGR